MDVASRIVDCLSAKGTAAAVGTAGLGEVRRRAPEPEVVHGLERILATNDVSEVSLTFSFLSFSTVS
jgi:hypothetical protein